MKRILFILLTLINSYSFAQVPKSFNYQGVSRDASGNPIINTSISVRTTIYDGSPTGTIQYQETQTTMTNGFGLFKMEIGNGTPTINVFDSIIWEVGTKFLEIEFDPNGGTNYILSGTTQILSVPYALHSGDITQDKIFALYLNSPTLKSRTGNFNLKDSRIWINNTLTLTDSLGSFGGNHLNMWIDNTNEKGFISCRGTPSSFPLILQYNPQRSIAGNVGIGFDSPTERLQVDGNISFTTRGQRLYFPGTTSFMDTSTCYITRPVGTDGLLFYGNDIYIRSIATPIQLQSVSTINMMDLLGNTKMIFNTQSIRFGIGTTSPSSTVTVTGGDVNITDINSGVILKSPNGQCWRVTVDNTGNLVRTSITCP